MAKQSPRQTRQTPRGGPSSWSSIAPFAWISLVAFALAFVLVLLFLSQASRLVSLGLDSRFFFVILVPLAASASVLLFRVLRSYAVYRGTTSLGAVELGGPIVCFFGILLGGYFIEPGRNFPLTVFVHGAAGRQDMPLVDRGEVVLDLGPERRNARIGDRGQALFTGIPASFRGQKVDIGLDRAPAYEVVDRSARELNAESVYLEVRRKPSHVAGTVVDEEGKPLAGASVVLAGVSATSGKVGEFTLAVPSARAGDELILHVTADGYQASSQRVIPNGTPVTAVLYR